MTSRFIDIPGSDVKAVFEGEDIHLSAPQGGSLRLTAPQLAYVLQEFGPFDVPVAPGLWRGWEGRG